MIWGQSLNSQTDIPRFGNPQPLPSVRPPQSSGLPSVQWPARQPLQSLARFHPSYLNCGTQGKKGRGGEESYAFVFNSKALKKMREHFLALHLFPPELSREARLSSNGGGSLVFFPVAGTRNLRGSGVVMKKKVKKNKKLRFQVLTLFSQKYILIFTVARRIHTKVF